jgi:hypothetical protein
MFGKFSVTLNFNTDALSRMLMLFEDKLKLIQRHLSLYKKKQHNKKVPNLLKKHLKMQKKRKKMVLKDQKGVTIKMSIQNQLQSLLKESSWTSRVPSSNIKKLKMA